MGTATATVSITAYPAGTDNSQKNLILRGTVKISASTDTYAKGGLALDFSKSEFAIANNLTPIDARFQGVQGYVYAYNAAANKLMIWQVPRTASLTNPSPLIELGDGQTIPAAVSNDVINFVAWFTR